MMAAIDGRLHLAPNVSVSRYASVSRSAEVVDYTHCRLETIQPWDASPMAVFRAAVFLAVTCCLVAIVTRRVTAQGRDEVTLNRKADGDRGIW